MWISNVTLHCCHHLRDAIIRSRSKRTSQKFQTKKNRKLVEKLQQDGCIDAFGENGEFHTLVTFEDMNFLDSA